MGLLFDCPQPMDAWLTQLKHHRAIAVIRVSDGEVGWHLAHAAAKGGMVCLEITWNSGQAPQLIAQLRRELPHCCIGTGTILTPQQLQGAIAAGAQFCFTPHTNPDLIQIARDQALPLIPGALSPTEIVQAWQAGAATVKVFPVQALGGVSYIRSLQGPLQEIPLIPTGGVNLENAADFLAAGAVAVGLSSELFPLPLIGDRNWGVIAERVQTLVRRLSIPFG